MEPPAVLRFFIITYRIERVPERAPERWYFVTFAVSCVSFLFLETFLVFALAIAIMFVINAFLHSRVAKGTHDAEDKEMWLLFLPPPYSSIPSRRHHMCDV